MKRMLLSLLLLTTLPGATCSDDDTGGGAEDGMHGSGSHDHEDASTGPTPTEEDSGTDAG